MSGLIVMVITLVLFPTFIVFWNRNRVKGKILGEFVRNDNSVEWKLCELRESFVIWNERAYELYPDFVRISRFPMGWPPFLQELVPCVLYNEEDSVPLDWITLGKRRDSSMELRAALDQNWIKKWVEETARAGEGAIGFNWRRVFPIILMGVGVIGLIFILQMQ